LAVEAIDLGKDIDPERVVEFETDWLGTEDDIEFVFGGCHCTDAWYSDGKIRGNIAVAKAGYDRNTGSLNQHVFVYLNDGRPYFTTDSKKRRISSTEKEWVRIALNGTVKI
jgi:hypothetical protein